MAGELPDYDDGEKLEDAEILLTEEDVGDIASEETEVEIPAAETPAEDAEVPPEEERVPSRAERRIKELAAERDEARARIADAEARAAEQANQAAEAQMAMIAHWHGRLEVQAVNIKAELAEAMRNGDTETQIDLTTKLNEVAANLATAAEALNVPRPEPTPAPAAPVAPAPPQVRTVQHPETRAWLGRNEWFDQNSAAFDGEMHEEARLYAKRVERRMRADNRAGEIGSTAYFMDIDQHMREEFPDAFDSPPPPARTVPPMKRTPGVAPVQRGGAPAAGAKTTKVEMSADMRSFARSMNANGAFPKIEGRRMTNEEAEKHYAAEVYKIKRNA